MTTIPPHHRKDWAYQAQAIEARVAQVEATPLEPNLWSMVKAAAKLNSSKPIWNFFEEGEDGLTATYGEMVQQVERMAAALYFAGVRKGTHVAVMLPNVPQFPTTWFAVARLGAVFVPVNVNYTDREINYILTDSDASFLVVHAECLPTYVALGDKSPVNSKNVLVLGGEGKAERMLSAIMSIAPDLPENIPEPSHDDLLNIQYTSGTTGFPKGCMLTHCYWLVLALTVSMRSPADDPLSRILIAQPYFYIDPLWLTLLAIRNGGCIFVARRASSSRFMDWVNRYGIEYCIFPEIVYQQTPVPLERKSSLKRVMINGFRKERHADLEDRFGIVAREAFGMTEVGEALFMPTEATHLVGSGSCGRRAPFCEVKIVDREGRKLPPGEVGELCVRGPGIMRGYYDKSEANAAAFRNDWFRTGDLFRVDDQGYYYISGRLKDMIRRSNENIAAHEVESVLLGCEGISEAAVVGVKDHSRGEEVKAYVVLHPGVTCDVVSPQLIFDYCSERLAAFKVPRFIEYRDMLPKTPSEKIAKHVLVSEKIDLRAGSFDRVTGAWL